MPIDQLIFVGLGTGLGFLVIRGTADEIRKILDENIVAIDFSNFL